MTELLEPISIGFITEEDTSCPFDHELDEPPTVKNDLYGDGGALDASMSNKTPKSTYLYEKLKNAYEIKRIPNPRKEKNGDLRSPKKPVKVKFQRAKMVGGNLVTYEHETRYPLSVAAHHCIPAQQSLKKCETILAYMVKQGEDAGLKLGSGESDFSGGVVWANVGYDVNGLQNGKYLPGNYAVTRGAMKKWAPKEGDDSEGVSEPPADGVELLTGTPDDALNDQNSCWQYVLQAVEKGKGQFHDSHEPYGDFVLLVLEAIGEDMTKFEVKVALGECDKCNERKELITKQGKGIPTDHELVTKLNKLSSKLMAYLNGTGWNEEIYTSRWMDAYMTKIIYPRNA